MYPLHKDLQESHETTNPQYRPKIPGKCVHYPLSLRSAKQK